MSLPSLLDDPVAATALAAAEAAAAVHLRGLGTVSLEAAVDKGIADFVTEVDLASQAAALEVIEAFLLIERPDDRILAEEGLEERAPEGGKGAAGIEARGAEGGGIGARRTEAAARGALWIVDPLDGTTNFLHGHPAFCASVGVVEGGKPVAGAVVAALTGERYLARAGMGAWGWRGARPAVDGRGGAPSSVVGEASSGGANRRSPGSLGPTPTRLRTSPTSSLRRALVGTGFPFKRPEEIPAYLAQLGRVLQGSGGVRRDGAAALDLCLLARGTFDAFWEGTLAPWDVAGGLAILAEAGGRWSGPEGEPYDVVAGGPLRAANGEPLLRALHPLLAGRAAPQG